MSITGRLRRRLRRSPTLIGAEFVIKRGLVTMLWLAWRSRLHPFMFLRDKGYTPGRYYVEHFLTQHVAECGGRFLDSATPTTPSPATTGATPATRSNCYSASAFATWRSPPTVTS
jgi:hypothetical protein